SRDHGFLLPDQLLDVASLCCAKTRSCPLTWRCARPRRGLPQGAPVHTFNGLADETGRPSHADLDARTIPQAQLHRLPARDHQLGKDLSEVPETVSPPCSSELIDGSSTRRRPRSTSATARKWIENVSRSRYYRMCDRLS